MSLGEPEDMITVPRYPIQNDKPKLESQRAPRAVWTIVTFTYLQRELPGGACYEGYITSQLFTSLLAIPLRAKLP